MLVEDEEGAADVARRLLESSGFEVTHFPDAGSALDFLDSMDQAVDLYVLDRKLPVLAGGTPVDEVGDHLLLQVRTSQPDARILVFTGRSDDDHFQSSHSGGGEIVAGRHRVDRINVVKKDQPLQFRDRVDEYRMLLTTLDNIEVVVDGAPPALESDRRALQRLAIQYDAVAVIAKTLNGGLTGVPVWLCDLRGTEGPVAHVVAKLVPPNDTPGGLPALLPRKNAVSITGALRCLIDGRQINVLQVASSDPVALAELQFEPQVADVVAELAGALNDVPDEPRVVMLEDLIAPLIDYEVLFDRAAELGLLIPDRRMAVSTRIGYRHCDLHPSNVLVDGGDPVLIDFDSNRPAAALIDPVSLLIGSLAHPESLLGGERWPTVEEIDRTFGGPKFGAEHSAEVWFSSLWTWMTSNSSGPREFWALALAASMRQLAYEDVTSDPEKRDRLVAIAAKSARELALS